MQTISKINRPISKTHQ